MSAISIYIYIYKYGSLYNVVWNSCECNLLMMIGILHFWNSHNSEVIKFDTGMK